MSVRRTSFLLSIQSLASATAVSPSSPPFRPRRPRASYMPLAFPPPPPLSASYSRSLQCPSHPAFVSPTTASSRLNAASLCMVCHPVAAQDDSVASTSRPANRVYLTHAITQGHSVPGPISPTAQTTPMSTMPPSQPSSTCMRFEPCSGPSEAPQIQPSSFDGRPDAQSQSAQHMQQVVAASTSSPAFASQNANTSPSPDVVLASRSHPGDSSADTTSDADVDPDADPALSTSTVTSLDSSDVPTADARDRHDTRTARLSLRTGAAFIPHPEKRDKGGEDAFFIQEHALGVFDGVGGWSSIGVDAGLYSKELARLTAMHIERDGPASAVEALKSATLNNRAIGSSTACVVGLEGDRLVGVNLGDSGLVIIRRGDVVYRTIEQQHYFNCPYQVGTDSLDTVDVGAPIEVMLQHGDCIIMGTDGLWDNVFAKDVVDIVVSHGATSTESTASPAPSLPSSVPSSPRSDDESPKDLLPSDGAVAEATSMLSECMNSKAGHFSTKHAQTIAQELADVAIKVANDDGGSSPFSVNAQNAGHLYLGGKVDDITILAALVVDPALGNDDENLGNTLGVAVDPAPSEATGIDSRADA